jgi:hypothetical protein
LFGRGWYAKATWRMGGSRRKKKVLGIGGIVYLQKREFSIYTPH